jgi:TolB-like protein
MEIVEGQTLNRRLAEGPLPLDQVLRYGLQLAEALAHAHERGVVHRDVKSGNVIITPEGRVKLLDFGLAKRFSQQDLADATTREQTSVTESKTVVGTLAYMAPEQLRAQPADARSDVWSLGVVLYEMAAGLRPFDGQSAYELSSAIFHVTPPPLPPRMPAQLQTVTNRCLEKEPGRRYQRASEARAALETVGTADSMQTTRYPRRLVAIVASLVLLVLIASALLNLTAIRQRLFGGSGQPIRSIAVLPLQNLSGDPDQEYFVAGMHEALITDLARTGLQKVIAKTSADMFKGSNKPLREIGRELGVDGIVTASVVRSTDRIRVTAQLVRPESGEVLWANRYDRNAGDVLSLQNDLVSAIAEEVKARISPEQTARLAASRRVNPAAHDAYLKGRFIYASFTGGVDIKRLYAAIAQFEEAMRIDPTYAPPYAAVSVAYLAATQTSFLPPKDTFPKAKAAALKAVELDDRLAEAHAALALVHLWYDWNWAGAEREIQRALEFNPDSVDTLIASEVHSVLVKARFDEAAATSQHMVDVDPLNPFVRLQTIWVAFFSRRYDDSIRNARTLIDLAPRTWFPHFFLAMNYGVKRMRPEVKAECDKVLELLAGAYYMQELGTCVGTLGIVGETDQARKILQVLEHPPSGWWLDPAVMAWAYLGLGDIDRAMSWVQKGVQERAPNMVYMNVNPWWDPVRSDPRFQAMLRQMSFPQ